MAVTLGISPGTRFVGLALFKDNALLHWQTKTFCRKWSAKKFRALLKAIDVYIVENRVTRVVVKIPDNYSHLKRIDMLIGGINVLCEQAKIKPQYYTLTQLKRAYTNRREISKEALMASIAHTYPELLPEYYKSQESKTKYYHRIFDAVLAGHVAITKK
jgi:Holliday junction resolvasome RuvABC endonuclease subunit